MTDHESVLQRMREANPAPALDGLHEEDLLAVRTLLDGKRGRTARHLAFDRERRWRRAVLAVATAFVLTLVAGTALFLLGRSEESPVVIPANAVLTWTRIPDTTGALSGPGTEYVAQVIAGGPGLVAVGSADECSDCWGHLEPFTVSKAAFDHSGRWDTRRGGAVWLSPDGEAWTRVPDPDGVFGAGVATLTGVADSGSRLVAIGVAATEGGSADGNVDPRPAVWVSDDDGASWARVPPGDAAFGGEGRHLMWTVIATDQGFVAAGDDLWTSPDGWEWTRVGPMKEVRRIARTDDGYVAVGIVIFESLYRAAAWTSADAMSWAPVELPAATPLINADNWSAATDVVAAPGGVVVVGQANGDNGSDGAVWLAGEDGEWSWVQGASDVFARSGNQEIRGVAAVADRLVAVGTQRPATLWADPIDPRFGPALSWVSSDGGRSWVRVEGETLGARGADLSMTAVAALDAKVVAMGGDGSDLAVWIGTWVGD